MGHVTLTTSLSGMICYHQAGAYYDPSILHTKSEVSIFTHYEHKNSDATYRKCGCLVTQDHWNVIIRYSAYDFLFTFNRNYVSIMYHLQDAVSFFVESRRFHLPHLHLPPSLGWPHLNFKTIFGIRKLESLGYRVVLFTLSNVQPFWYNTRIWQTYRQTGWQHIPRNQSSRCKNLVSITAESPVLQHDKCKSTATYDWLAIHALLQCIYKVTCKFIPNWSHINAPPQLDVQCTSVLFILFTENTKQTPQYVIWFQHAIHLTYTKATLTFYLLHSRTNSKTHHTQWSTNKTLKLCTQIHTEQTVQEAQLSPRDCAGRRVFWNLANCHATVQKLLVQQVLNKSKLWSWRVTVRQCVLNMCTQPWRDWVASTVL